MTKFFLDQYGCAKNQVDGELIVARLRAMGFEQTQTQDNADIIIVNSCGFIQSAKTESLNAVLQAKSKFPNAKVLLAGCLAQRYAETLYKDLPEADGIFGNGDISALDEIIPPLLRGTRPLKTPEQKGISCGERTEFLSFPGSAYVKITEGCDNCCSFCAIPLIRGRLRSRTQDDIVNEIRQLLKRGIFEINLVGQDSASYGMDGVPPHDTKIWSQFNGSEENGKQSPLASLLKKISMLEGKFWVRILYIHPDHFPLDILPVIAGDKRILPYFDIPFQSGSDSILNKMNRTGSASQYVQLVDKIRSSLAKTDYKGIALRTTFLAGFPGETEKDAEKTAGFLAQIKPDWSGCFSYSKEDDTPAEKMKNQVPAKTAKKRVEKLQAIQTDLTAQALQKRCDKTYDILVEEVIQGGDGEGTGLAIGRAWFQAADVDGAVVIRYELDSPQSQKIQPGAVVPVHVTGVSGVDMTGEAI